jgi:uncharacterized protein (DUF1330 family)
MPKGYIIAHIDIHHPQSYKRYVELSSAAVASYRGTFLIRGGDSEPAEGTLRARHAVIEFPSFAEARAFYYSQQYETARAVRTKASTADLVIVEGVDPGS